MENAQQVKTVRVQLGGETLWATPETWNEAADTLVAKHGGIPKVEQLSARDALVAQGEVEADPMASHFRDDTASAGDVEAKIAALTTQPAPADPYGADEIGGSHPVSDADLQRERVAAVMGTAVGIDSKVAATMQTVGAIASPGLRLGDTEPAPSAVVPRGARNPGVRVGHVDEEGRDRSQTDYDAAVAAGFSPAQPYYDRGSPVIDLGVANAKKKRREWERMPSTREGCIELRDTVRDEKRHEVIAEACNLSMLQDGQLHASIRTEDGIRTEQSLPLTEAALNGLTSRLGFGGGQYLGRCWPSLRAHNVNAWIDRRRAERGEAEIAGRAEAEATGKVYKPSDDLELRLRQRLNARSQSKEIYAVVSPDYADLDTDMIAEALAEACPPEARGRVTYDGTRARIEMLFHSTVQPDKYVAGEFFRAGVVIRTDDTGGGSISGNAYIWQNLCLNLLCIDRSSAGAFRIRHMGDRDQLIVAFRKGFETALHSISHFRKAWGFAVEEDVVAQVRRDHDDAPARIEDVLPGIFNGIVQRELVPVFARKDAAVPLLMDAWGRDTSGAKGPTRAAIVNAFTRYAHEAIDVDPWKEDEIARSAGRLLYGRGANGRPSPLPYEPVEV